MGVLLPETEEEQRRKTITWLGSVLILGFIFPIYFSVFGRGKLIFANFEMIGKVDFFTTLSALYPLIAGILVLWVGLNIEPIKRPLALLGVGLFPILTSILNRNDFLASSIREYNKETTIMFLIILSLIGMYVGSKIVSVIDHSSGRSIGGVSGIVFLILVLLPVTGGTPTYFGLFSLFKTGTQMKMPGSMMLLGIAFIAIFTAYIFAAIINILNFSSRSNSQQTAANATKMIFYSTLAIPISILVGVLLAGGGVGFGMIFTALVKICLVLGGIIGTIVTGLLDLIDQYLPRTVKGGDLLKNV
jgi:MFS family permease